MLYTGTAASWAGWAVTSLTSKLYKPSTGSTSELDGNTAAGPPPPREKQPATAAAAARPQPGSVCVREWAKFGQNANAKGYTSWRLTEYHM